MVAFWGWLFGNKSLDVQAESTAKPTQSWSDQTWAGNEILNNIDTIAKARGWPEELRGQVRELLYGAYNASSDTPTMIAIFVDSLVYGGYLDQMPASDKFVDYLKSAVEAAKSDAAFKDGPDWWSAILKTLDDLKKLAENVAIGGGAVGILAIAAALVFYLPRRR